MNSLRARTLLIGGLVLAALLQPASQAAPALAAGQSNAPGEDIRHAQQHVQQLLNQYKDPSGKIRMDLRTKGIAQVRRMRVLAALPAGSAGTGPVLRTSELRRASTHHHTSAVQRRSRAELVPGGVVGVQWEQMGPAPMRVDSNQVVQGSGPDSGQVTDVAIDPRGAIDQTIYIATDDGGIWKTTDGGTSWAPKTDFMPNLSMGAVALDPTNPSVVYAGTGDQFNNGFFKGIGLYKSIDGGDTWTNLNPNGIFTGLAIYRIVVLPSNVVLVATTSGLFRSVDGGQSFGANSPQYNDGKAILAGGEAYDLKVDSSSSSTVYVTIAGKGLYKSVDSGATFGANSPSFNDGTVLFNPGGNFYDLSFTQAAPPNNQTMYVAVEDATNFTPGKIAGCQIRLYESTNGGTSWAQQTATNAAGCYFAPGETDYGMVLGVDPQQPAVVYLGMIDLWKSTDSGATFAKVGDSDIHDDVHAVVFTPQSHWGPSTTTTMWVGNDGGISTSSDAGGTWTNPDEGIATNLFFNMDIGRGSATNNGYSYAAAQDQGVSQHTPASSGNDWHLNTGGDGTIVVVDPGNAQHAYGAINNQLLATTDAGASWPAPSANGLPKNPAPNNCCGLVANLAVDPNNGANVYAVSQTNNAQLFLSTDSAANFTSMKTFAASINAIATTGTDSNTVWVGLNDGTVWSTTNALSTTGSTWTQHTVTGAPAGQGVSGLAIDPSNTQQVVVIYPGFCSCGTNVTKHAFMTTDGGSTWSNISGTQGGDPASNLPDLPLHSVVIDPGVTPHAIIVASDSAILRSGDNGATWQVLGAGFPTVDANSLQLDSTSSPSVLRIGTYGRSVYELRRGSGLSVNSNLAFGTVPVGGTATSVIQVFNVGSSNLHISSFSRVFGSTAFTILSGPPAPVTIAPGEEIDYTIQFAPTAAGSQTAQFQIQSDDSNTPVWTIPASGTGGAPQMTLSGDLNFGTVARGTSATRTVTVYDTGQAPLTISSVSFDGTSSGAFSVLGPATPTTVQVGEQVSFTVQFAPPLASNGASLSGTLRLKGYDALYSALTVPDQTVAATGTPGIPVINLGSGSLAFGNVPVDDRTTPYYADQTLNITNQASCPLCDLHISSLQITPSGSDFTVVSPTSLPATIGAGNNLNVTIRFNPTAGGSRTATLTVSSDDPKNPTLTVALSGAGLLPSIYPAPTPLIFPPTVYDPICSPGCGTTQNETISNNGQAELILDSLSMTNGSPPFTAAPPTNPVTRVQPSSSFLEAVTFHPTAQARAVNGTLQIQDTVLANLTNPALNFNITQNVPVCGEAVGRGIRVLVKNTSGATVPSVGMLTLQSHGLVNPISIQLKNLALQTINPPTSCQQINFHYENQKLQPAGTVSNPGSYYVLSVSVGSKKVTTSFTLGLNEFKQMTVVVQ